MSEERNTPPPLSGEGSVGTPTAEWIITDKMIGALLDVDMRKGDFRHLRETWAPKIGAMLAHCSRGEVLGDDIDAPNYPTPPDGWVCYHCGVRFRAPGAARRHFGELPGDWPACVEKAAPLPAQEVTDAMGWRDTETDPPPTDGTLFLTYWGTTPVFCAAMPDEARSFRVMALGRDGQFYVHGNYAPFKPRAWRPLPGPPESALRTGGEPPAS